MNPFNSPFGVAVLAGSLFLSSAFGQTPDVQNANGEIRILLEIPGVGPETERVALHPAQSLVAATHEGGKVDLYSIGGLQSPLFQWVLPSSPAAFLGTPVEVWAQHNADNVNGIAFSPDGLRLYAVMGDGGLHVLDPAMGTVLSVQALDEPVTRMALNPAGNRMLIGTERGKVVEYSIPVDGSPVSVTRVIRPQDDSKGVAFVAYSPSGSVIYTSLEDYHLAEDAEAGTGGSLTNGGLTSWVASTGLRQTRFGAPEGSVAAVEQPGGAGRVFAAGQDHETIEFDTNGDQQWSEELTGTPGIGVVKALGAGGDFLVSTGFSGLYLHALSAPPSFSIQFPVKRSFGSLNPDSLCTSYQDGLIAVGSFSGGLVVLSFTDAAQGPHSSSLQVTLQTIGGVALVEDLELIGHSSPIQEVQVSKTGAHVASRDDSGKGICWTREPDGTYTAYPLGLNLAHAWQRQRVFSFSADETILAIIGDGGVLHTIDLTDPNRPEVVLNLHDASASIPVLSALYVTGGQVLAGGFDRGLYVFDAQSGLLLHTLVAPVPESDNRTYPYTTLLPAPTANLVFTAPTSITEGVATGHVGYLWNMSSWVSTGTFVDEYSGGTFACVNPTYFCLANGGEAKGLAFFNSQSLAFLDGAPIPARVGVTCSLNNEAFAFDAGTVTKAWLQAGVLESLSEPLNLSVPIRAAGSGAEEDAIFLGLDSGAIIRVVPQ